MCYVQQLVDVSTVCLDNGHANSGLLTETADGAWSTIQQLITRHR